VILPNFVGGDLFKRDTHIFCKGNQAFQEVCHKWFSGVKILTAQDRNFQLRQQGELEVKFAVNL